MQEIVSFFLFPPFLNLLVVSARSCRQGEEGSVGKRFRVCLRACVELSSKVTETGKGSVLRRLLRQGLRVSLSCPPVMETNEV